MRILIDGVFFQMPASGIGRVWMSLFDAWRRSGFAAHVTVLDRARTTPRIPGIDHVTIPPHDYTRLDADRAGLQRVCDSLGADLFVSTYYSRPLSAPSLLVVHDFIPEALGMDLTLPMWREKAAAIDYASAYICVSQHTASGIARFYPAVADRPVAVIPNAVDHALFRVPSAAEIAAFRARHGLERPYFLTVGLRSGYKNVELLFRAFASWPERPRHQIVCLGGHSPLEAELRALVPEVRTEPLRLDDDELRAAYGGALALVFPSRHEGFGLPLAEAMACGCPVITCRHSAIPEVVAEAGLFVGPDDVAGLTRALEAVRDPAAHARLAAAGRVRSARFDWTESARRYAETFTAVAARRGTTAV